MAQAISTSITRRSAVAGLALTAGPLAVLAGAENAYAQAQQTMPEKTLYERLGGVFAIAAVVDHFSDAVVKNPTVGQKSKNPQLREWHTKNLGRLPRRRSALRRPIGTCGSHPQNLMRSQQNSGGPWTSSRFQNMRSPKSWQLSPPTSTRSPLVTSLSAAELAVSQSR